MISKARRVHYAYKARRDGISGAIKAARTLVQRGACAQTVLCDELEWHPFVAEAQESEDFIELSFMEAVHGVAPPA